MSSLLSDAFVEQLQSAEPDFGWIRRHIIGAYSAETGNSLPYDLCPTDQRLQDVSRWLNEHAEKVLPYMYGHRKVLIPTYSSSLSGKALALGQFHCPLCGDGAHLGFFPIRIRPRSFQSAKSKIKSAFKKAIARRFERLGKPKVPSEADLCVHVLFVMTAHNRDGDVDNLPKLLLDSLKGILYHDDKQIVHLSSLRFSWSGEEEYVLLNIKESRVNRHEDVFFQQMHHGWGGADELRLEDFF